MRPSDSLGEGETSVIVDCVNCAMQHFGTDKMDQFVLRFNGTDDLINIADYEYISMHEEELIADAVFAALKKRRRRTNPVRALFSRLFPHMFHWCPIHG